ncbi:TIGR04282 family arsenosugar biosynthesis glycosyltransferase [Hymenobacter puniceus]|uniref:TIGR04282 family arsenosugar biosynthesis glycosyltransferase n=1 Tax=Hymenobacter sp. BT190 TaxID=2763505 RepID=UPI001650E03C|nr:DUF2064 domain-containing protein [Hymenobacter sp. BT190]MBC6699888.1 DUF2064 domain-containing protein [Hymenobacter sp. BT190]
MSTTALVAILLFTRSAGEEGARKRFLSEGTPADNAAVAAHLISHTAATAHRAGVDVVCVDSSQQVGTTFDQRLAAAMRATFARGYEHLLVIGNDCPQLTSILLRQAVKAVLATGAVLGPATDGGVYLLGLSRTLFEQGAGQKLPWQTLHLMAALRRQLRQLGTVVHQLPALADVDDEASLARVLRQPLTWQLHRRLHQLRTARRHRPGPLSLVPRRQPALSARLHRGPPAH